MAKQRNFGLDLIRAIAISLVLISHCSLLFYPDSQPLIKTILMLGGTLGVDIFFVLSGYLIGGILLNHCENNKLQLPDITYFWVRRWFRTLPNYFLILFINCFLGIYLFKQIPDDIGSYFYFFQNFSHAQSDFFTESWSLSIEEFSYLFTPMAVMLFYTIKKNGKMAFLLGSLLLITLANFSRIHYHLSEINMDYHFWTTSLRKVVIYRIDAICYGFLAIYAARYFKKHIKKYALHSFYAGALTLIGLYLIIFIFNLTPNTAPLLYNIVYFPIIGLTLAAMHWYITEKHTNSKRINNVVKYISTRSYAVYLINFSIVFMSINFFSAKEFIFIPKPLMIVLYLGITFVLSELLYRFYEKPFMNLRDRAIFKPHKK